MVELFDFYEGRHPLLHHLPLWGDDPSMTRDQYLLKVINKVMAVDERYGFWMMDILGFILQLPSEELFTNHNLLRPNTTEDHFFVESGCELVTIAVWNERFDRLLINKNWYSKLSPMGQAGILIHEVIYKISRDRLDVKNSNQVRKIIALLFSSIDLTRKDLESVFGLPVISWDILKKKLPEVGECLIEAEIENLNADLFKINYAGMYLQHAIDASNRDFHIIIQNEKVQKVTQRLSCSHLKRIGQLLFTFHFQGSAPVAYHNHLEMTLLRYSVNIIFSEMSSKRSETIIDLLYTTKNSIKGNHRLRDYVLLRNVGYQKI